MERGDNLHLKCPSAPSGTVSEHKLVKPGTVSVQRLCRDGLGTTETTTGCEEDHWQELEVSPGDPRASVLMLVLPGVKQDLPFVRGGQGEVDLPSALPWLFLSAFDKGANMKNTQNR